MACRCLISQCSPSYASVLVCGEEDLDKQVEALEKQLLPTITAWCQECKKPCLITRDLHLFQQASEHHVHQIVSAKSLMDLDLMGDN